MTTKDIRPFMRQIFAVSPSFGTDAEDWISTMAGLVASLEPAPTPQRLVGLVRAIAARVPDRGAPVGLPQFHEIEAAYADGPGAESLDLENNRVRPDRNCKACRRDGIMTRWTLTPAGDMLGTWTHPIADRYEDQISFNATAWNGCLQAARDFQALLSAPSCRQQLVEVAEWCRCPYGAYRKAIEIASREERKRKR